MRKHHPAAKLLNLPQEKKDIILEWMLAGQPYHAVRDLVKEQFGISSSISSFSTFYSEEAPKRLIERRLGALRLAQELAEEAQKRPSQFDSATIEALREKAFALAINPNAPAKDVKSLLMLLLKSRDQDLKERQVVLLEKKAAQADEAAKVVGDKELTPAERDQRMRQIFGVS
jgi:hypothetical protein